MSRARAGAWLAAASAICFGSLGVFTKLAHAAGWNDPSLLAVRFILTSLVMLPFALRARSEPRWFGAAFLVGALGYTATTATYFPSLRYLPAAVSAFLLYLAPPIVAVLATFLLGERLRTRGIIAIAIAIGGLVLLGAGAFTGSLSPLGVLLACGAALSYALTTVAGRSVSPRLPWSHMSLGVALGAATSYLLFASFTHQLAIPPGRDAILWVLGVGAFSTGIALPLFFAALARAPASQVSVISTLEPVSTLVLAAIFLHEVPTWLAIAGGALIVVAAAVIALDEPPPPIPE